MDLEIKKDGQNRPVEILPKVRRGSAGIERGPIKKYVAEGLENCASSFINYNG